MNQTAPVILDNWEKENGRCWVKEIETIANRGGTWRDAGELFDIPSYRLKSFCNRRGFKFPWQGHKSPIQRDHQRRMTLDNPPPGKKPRTYEYNGDRYTLRQLVDMSPFELSITTVRFRITRGLSIKEAINTPKMEDWEKGRKGGLATSRKYAKTTERPENYRPFHGLHGLSDRTDRGRVG